MRTDGANRRGPRALTRESSLTGSLRRHLARMLEIRSQIAQCSRSFLRSSPKPRVHPHQPNLSVSFTAAEAKKRTPKNPGLEECRDSPWREHTLQRIQVPLVLPRLDPVRFSSVLDLMTQKLATQGNKIRQLIMRKNTRSHAMETTNAASVVEEANVPTRKRRKKRRRQIQSMKQSRSFSGTGWTGVEARVMGIYANHGIFPPSVDAATRPSRSRSLARLRESKGSTLFKTRPLSKASS